MAILIDLHHRVFGFLDQTVAPWLLPTLARLVFAGVLLLYFWKSAMTKLGDGIFGLFSPSAGAYAQIFPEKAELVSYNTSAFSVGEWLIVMLGTWAEFFLPALIVLGLLTRLASIGMIVFVFVQSLTDIYGHGADAQTIGAWFDGRSDALILDQRAFWVFLLLFLALKGGGPFALDRLIGLEQRRE